MTRIFLCTFILLTSLPSMAADDLSNELALAESWLAAQRAYDHVPGLSAAIVHDQELLWSGASGFSDLESQRPAEADTIYGICSISKLFTGIAVMQLRDQGKVGLDDPVSTLLPWFNLKQSFEGSPEITLRNLLTHASGLPREADEPYWVGPDFPFPTRERIRELLGGQATIYVADRYHQYSNLGLSLVGEIVAEKSGQDYTAYVDEHVLGPLGLADTSTGFPTDNREPRIATGYGYSGRDGALPPMPRYDARGITPAAGFASTALDLARFASWQFRLLGGKPDEVLQANTLREMQRVQWMDWDWSIARGLAFGVYRIGDRTLAGHGGDCPGFNTRLYMDPVSRYAVVTMANRNNVNVDGYAAKIFDILEAGGTPQKKTDAEIAASTDLEPYIGNYDIRPWGGEDMVFRWKSGLAMINLPTMDPLGGLVRLRHIEGDRFHTVRSDDQDGHEVSFQRNAAGEVTHIVYHGTVWPKM
jgi:CubicO group peptidase (beta-lactamase class C family)